MDFTGLNYLFFIEITSRESNNDFISAIFYEKGILTTFACKSLSRTLM